MTMLKVLKYPDPFLKTKTKTQPPADLSADLSSDLPGNTSWAQIKADMLETMYAEQGVGLAATQVGLNLRLFVMDCSETRDQPKIFINPIITEKLEEIDSEEGCLSFPGIYVNVKRARKITVTALDIHGQSFTETYVGLEARCVQHEIDHLDGIVFLDYLQPVKRKMLEKKLQKLQKRTL